MNPDIIVGGVGKTGRLPLMIIGETSSDCSWAGLACYIVRWLRAVTRTLLQRTTSTRHEPGLNIATLITM